jgi:DNA-binding GntR family transcriptional regulator
LASRFRGVLDIAAQHEQLPSESDFMEEFELGRSTVRRTMAYLREQGLVETVPTRGTYVK